MNAANRLTLARIGLIPLFMFLLLGPLPHGEYPAAAVYVLAAITDGLDGYLARSRGQVTRLGQFLDPLADKLLVSTALISMTGLNMVPEWVAVVIVGRELAVTGLRTIAAGEGMVIAASALGKIKTNTQTVAIVALLIHNYPLSLIGFPVGEIALYLAVFLTAISGIDYFRQAAHEFNGER